MPKIMIRNLRTILPLSLIGVLIFHSLINLPFLGVHLLTYDEAHYALYGYNLAWSYFDHPPLVGWVQAFMQLFGDSEWLLRFPAFLTSAILLISAWLFLADYFKATNESVCPYGCTRICTAQWIIFLILFYSSPYLLFLSYAFLPDSILMALILPLVMQTRKAVASDKWQDYILLGALFGIAGLAKYTAVLIALGALIYIFWQKGWKVFGSPRAWMALIIAVSFVTPVLIWNLQTDGASFSYQFNHVLGGGIDFSLASLGDAGLDILIAQASELAGFGPLVYVLGISALVWIIITKQKDLYILLIFIAPCAVFFTFSPAFGRFLPHWVAYMYVLILPAVAIMLQKWAASFSASKKSDEDVNDMAINDELISNADARQSQLSQEDTLPSQNGLVALLNRSFNSLGANIVKIVVIVMSFVIAYAAILVMRLFLAGVYLPFVPNLPPIFWWLA